MATDDPLASAWLTYQQASTRLGLTPAAVAARARRRKWPKRKNPARNDDQVEVLVPAEDLARSAPPTAGPTVGDTAAPTPPDTVAPDATIAALQAAFQALQAALDRSDGDRRELQRQADQVREQLAAVQVERAEAIGRMNTANARAEQLELRLAEAHRLVEELRQQAEKRRWWWPF